MDLAFPRQHQDGAGPGIPESSKSLYVGNLHPYVNETMLQVCSLCSCRSAASSDSWEADPVLLLVQEIFTTLGEPSVLMPLAGTHRGGCRGTASHGNAADLLPWLSWGYHLQQAVHDKTVGVVQAPCWR